MSPMIHVESWPKLRDPVLIVSFAGWIDAGLAGAGSMTVLADRLHAGAQFATVDLADLSDLRATRPTVHLVDGTTRRIRWPEIRFLAGHLGRDVVLGVGPEPSLHWRALLDEMVDLAKRLGVSRAVTLGGAPMAVTHHQPIGLLATATSAELLSEVGGSPIDYVGPSGMHSTLQVMLGEAGIPTVGFWAQVPHYVAATPSPPAVRALLGALRHFMAIETEPGALDDQVDTYVRLVDESVAERPELAEAIRAIDARPADELPSADELAAEIERFLRDQS
jgi:proteasome assembly chaperone (PAC2) family protein